MVTPGLYKHYKGNSYRVLFCAVWRERVTPADDVEVVLGCDSTGRELYACAVGSSGQVPAADLLLARWSGNTHIEYAETVVVYVALYGIGRVSVRPVREFEGQVPRLDGGPGTEPRFIRVCA